MLFWILVVVAGAIGTIADVVLNRWSTAPELRLQFWLEAAVLILVFATIFGYAMRLGRLAGYPLGVIVLIVLTINVGMVVAVDAWMTGTSLTATQWVGVGLGLGACACFELG